MPATFDRYFNSLIGMDVKNLRLVLGLAAFAIAIFLAQLWQPARQVRLHQRHLLRAVEKRNWPAVGRFIGAEYRDRWGHDKENLIGRTTEVFGQFLLCHLVGEERTLSVAGGTGIIAEKITLGGTGSPLADYAKERVNALTEPFTFKWVHRGWKPWEWQLIECDHPRLEIEAGGGY